MENEFSLPVTIHKDLEWLVHQLWSFCASEEEDTIVAPAHCDELCTANENTAQSRIFPLYIPDTVIFRDGIPWKWIGTDQYGILRRKRLKFCKKSNIVLLEEELNRIRSSFVVLSQTWRHKNQEKSELLVQSKKCSKLTNVGDEADPKAKIGILHYQDGKREYVSSERFSILYHNAELREKIVSIQAWIGQDDKEEDSRAKTIKDVKIYLSSSAVGVYCCDTSKIARVHSMIIKSKQMKNQRLTLDPVNQAVETLAMILNKCMDITIHTLIVDCVVDSHHCNIIWLTHVLEVTYQVPIRNRFRIDPEQKSSVVSSQEEALRLSLSILRSILVTSEEDSLDLKIHKYFSYLDRQGNGRITATDLQSGLARVLHRSISYDACENLVAIIGRSNPRYFCQTDLKLYAETSPMDLIDSILTTSSTYHENILSPPFHSSSDTGDIGRSCQSPSSSRCYLDKTLQNTSKDAEYVLLNSQGFGNDETPDTRTENDETTALKSITRSSVCLQWPVSKTLEEVPIFTMVDAGISKTNNPLVNTMLKHNFGDMHKTNVESQTIDKLQHAAMPDIEPKCEESKHIQVSDLEVLSKLDFDGFPYGVYILTEKNIFLYEIKSLIIDRDDGVNVHRFVVQNDDLTTKLASLTLSIVYFGAFESDDYDPGQLIVSLQYFPIRRFPVQLSEISGAQFYPVGDVRNHDKNNKYGHVSILYSPQPYVKSGLFEVHIKTDSRCRYSVNITGSICSVAEEAISKSFIKYFQNEVQGSHHRTCSSTGWLDLRLEERKLFIIESFALDTEEQIKRCQLDIEEYEHMYVSPRAQGSHQHTRFIETDLLHYCHLKTAWDKEIVNICHKMKHTVKKRLENATLADSLEIENKSLRNTLSASIKCIYGTRHYSRIDKILTNVFKHDYMTSISFCNSPSMSSDYTAALERPDAFYSSNTNDRFSDDGIDDGMNWGYWQPRIIPLLRYNPFSDHNMKENLQNQVITLMKELIRVVNCRKDFVDSRVMHVSPQLFPRNDLVIDIDCDLTSLLRTQILNSESVQLINSIRDEGDEESIDSDSSIDSEIMIHTSDSHVRRLHASHLLTICDMDTLQSLDQDRNILAARQKHLKQMGSGSCLACSNAVCKWTSSVNDAKLDERRNIISQEIIFLRKQGKQKNDIATSLERLKDLELEAHMIDVERMLGRVDKELHDAYATTSERVLPIRSLHGYDTLMPLGKAMDALERERNRLIVTLTSRQLVEEILDWMLLGWYFGEPKTEDVTISNELSKVESISCSENENAETQWMLITAHARNHVLRDNFNHFADHTVKRLAVLENNLRYFFFCVTFMYFQTFATVRREQRSWNPSKILHGRAITARKAISIENESSKTMDEEKNSLRRKSLLDQFLRKAAVGASRIKQRQDLQALLRVQQRIAKNRKTMGQIFFVVTIQRYYRGHLGRKVARRWSQDVARSRAWNGLCNSCAVAISRVWRGYTARRQAALWKEDLAKYIFELRCRDGKQMFAIQ